MPEQIYYDYTKLLVKMVIFLLVLLPNEWVIFSVSSDKTPTSSRRSDRRQHTSQNLQAQVFLVAQAIRTPLKDTNLVVEAFDKS